MDVALNGDDLFALEGVGEWRNAGKLNFVPLAVDLGNGMDVVWEMGSLLEILTSWPTRKASTCVV